MQTSRHPHVGRMKKIFHLEYEKVQDRMHAVVSISLSSSLRLTLAHSISPLSVGAKSHVSRASGSVDSFTNRNVKHHPHGGLRDKGEPSRAGNRTIEAQVFFYQLDSEFL